MDHCCMRIMKSGGWSHERNVSEGHLLTRRRLRGLREDGEERQE